MSCRKVQGGELGVFPIPTVTHITSNGSYTSPAGARYLEVYAIGGGGGGGGGVVGGMSGSGGGAGGVSYKIFAPGTYAVTCGTGGAGNAGTAAGSAGTSTDFGTGALIANGGSGGSGGTSSTPRRGGLSGAIHVTSLYPLTAEPGHPGTISRSGRGGANLFGDSGQGSTGSVVPTAAPGSVYGGGASGGNNGGGAAGGEGGVIVFEYY